MSRTRSLLLAGLFLGFIFALPLMSLYNEDAQVSEFEKRKLAQFPTFSLTLSSMLKFPRQFEEYFNDQLGGRDRFVSLHNTFNFKVLQKSPLPAAIVGEKEWLFSAVDGELLDYMGLLQKDFSTLEGFRHVLEDRQEWLARLGIRYLFLPVPNKTMVYDEYLPLRIRQEKGQTVYDQFTGHMRQFSNFTDFLDLKAILLKAKKERQIYFRTDTHWNLDGALVADSFIVEHLRQWFPQLQKIDLSELERNDVFYRGDLAILMHIHGAIGEQSSVLKMKKPCRKKENQKVLGFVNKNKKLAGDERFLPETNGCTGKPLKALVIHDSFGLFLRPFLSEQFGQVIYMNYSSFSGMKEWIIQERPDVVIDQRVARNLHLALAHDVEIEHEMVQEMFARTETSCLFLAGEHAASKIVNSHDLRISQGERGVLLNASSEDPYLVFSSGQCAGKGETIVHISLTASQETEMQFYYTTANQSEFTAAFSRTLPVQTGRNQLFFRIPQPGIGDKIRLDPGKTPGDFVLHELRIQLSERQPVSRP